MRVAGRYKRGEKLEVEEMKIDELKPCPFCGGRASARRFDGKFFDVYKVYCMNEDCYIEPATRPYYSKKEAIEAWNRRVDDGKDD